MDFIQKNKALFWCVIVLIVMNVLTLGTIWKHRPAQRRRPSSGGHKVMEKQLGLSSAQAQTFEDLRDVHFNQTEPIQDHMHELRVELLDKLFEHDPNVLEMDKLFSMLARHQDQFERALFQHFDELRSACNEEQVDHLKQMLLKLIERSRPMAPQRPSRGAPPGRRPLHGPPPPRQPEGF